MQISATYRSLYIDVISRDRRLRCSRYKPRNRYLSRERGKTPPKYRASSLRNGAARRGAEINFVSCFSAVSRKREAGILNRVRAKCLSRLLPSAGSCTRARRVGGGPEGQRGEAGI